ncbi:hypothetical protein OG264_39450 (plasmid) [Streptomyces xanthophaeus]|uniref:DUF6059 family protein n=1 Tax=Streptomyces xanthophaeus TaxID=67385 RepID=UPI002F90B56B|nr:hypothetical protein OG264_39450 [Streptomyces xanthophaeus]WST65957.1 hypothetical protein OG605_40670 [Streptomyces xanthophaeus]
MKRLLRGGRRALTDYCVRPLWRALVTFGSTLSGPTTYHHAVRAPRLSARSFDVFTWYAPAGLQLLPPGSGGPPPDHPERLCEDAPLSEEELLLARELWPTQYSERRDPGHS